MSKARSYKPSHIKMLFALSGNECAMSNCKNNLITKDDATVVGKICHIEAANVNGPRWNKFMNDDERRDASNLILMCSEHHDLIDNKENEKIYTVRKLKKMKSEHEAGNYRHQFELTEDHLEQLLTKLNDISGLIFDTESTIKNSQKKLKSIDENTGETLTIVQQLADKLLTNNTPNDRSEINNFIEKSKEYDWLSLREFSLFQSVIDDCNQKIVGQRKAFIFTQNVIQAMFEVTNLKQIINSWHENRFQPEKLDHIQFIQYGVMAYECLESIPDDIINNLRLHNWCPIHHLYFNGYLGSFIIELKNAIEYSIDLVDTYRSDRYLFENLTRIFSSLKGFLEVDVDEVYLDKKQAEIIEKLPNEFLILSTSNEITVRDHVDCSKVLAKLPVHRQFKITKIEIIQQGEVTNFISFNAQCCFFWNPEKDLVETTFLKVSKGQEVTDIFCELNSNGEIQCVVQLGRKLIEFINFKEVRSVTLTDGLNLSRHNSGFVGIKANYLNSNGPLLFAVDENFNVEEILTIENLRSWVEQDESILEWMTSVRGDEVPFKRIFDKLQNISVQSLNENIVLIKGKIHFSSVLIFLQIIGNKFEYLKVHLLDKSVSITIDSLSSSDTLELCCGYLNMNGNNSLFEHIKFKGFNILSNESIVKPESNFSNITDIYQVCFGQKGDVFLNEMGNRLFKYSFATGLFYEYLIPDEEVIHNIKFFSSSIIFND